MDRKDKQILRELQRDGRLTNAELAERVNLSPTPCARRVKRFEDEGLIQGTTTILDAEKLGLSLTAYIAVSMQKHTDDVFEKFEARVVEFPEVTSGNADVSPALEKVPDSFEEHFYQCESDKGKKKKKNLRCWQKHFH